jgi:ABC-type branched-subunit amino acid transport system ATPase component/ABC-type branched-subunit amino acid transport system permease subunit
MSIRLVVRWGSLGLAGVAVVGWVWVAPFSLLGTANLALGYAIVAVSLVLLTGWVGQISLAQASFVGIGAFVTGVVVRAGVPFPLTLPIGAGAAAVSAALLGMVALRVRGLYLAVATLIFAWMTQEYLFNQPWLAGVGGSSSAPADPVGTEGTFPFLDFAERRTFYYVILAATVTAVLAAANLRDSKTGRAWFAVKGSEVAAASLGIPVMRYKLLAFAVSGFLAGVAGCLIMTHQQVTTATAFAPNVSLFFLAVAVVGGLGSLGGAIASGALFASLEELFFRVDLSGFLEIVSAGLLAGVLLFFPVGLAGIPLRAALLARAVAGAGVVRSGARFVRDLAGELGRFLRPTLNRSDSEERDREEAVIWLDRTSETDDGEQHDEVIQRSSIGRLLAPFSAAAARLVKRRVDLGEAPDVLAASLTAAREAREAEDDDTEQVALDVPAGLSYVAGTATKVELPPRGDRPLVLAASGITVRFGGLTAVDDVSLEVREGEIVGLIGPNGAGKTTLFNAISGLNQPTSGTVDLFGRDITTLDVHERARCGMGRTFQVIQLFPQLSVFDNLMVATHTRNSTGFFAHVLATGGAVDSERLARLRVGQVVRLLGLEEVAARPVAGLPFGVLRLVEVARALVTGAPFVMLDEPASGLDNAETDRLSDLLLWVRQSLGVTLLLIEHDVRMVTSLTDFMYVIDRGKRIAAGTPADVQRDEAVIAAYLGRVATDEPELVTAAAGSV